MAPAPPADEPKTELKLGGYFMGGVHYDTNNNISRPWLARVNGDGDPSLDIDPLPTRLTVTATTKYQGMEGKGYVEVDLKLGELGRLRQAYASFGGGWGSVLIGQAYTMAGGWHFIDSYNIDAFFSQGASYTRQPQVRYTRKLGDLQLHLAATTYRGMGGVVVHPAAVGTATVVELPEVPYVQARIEHAVLGKGSVAVAAAVGQFEVSFAPGMMSPLAAFTRKATAAIGVVDIVLPLGKHKLAAHAFYTRSGGQSSGVAQAVVVDDDGSLEPVTSIGGFLNAVFALGGGARLSVFGTIDNPTDHAGNATLPLQRNLVIGTLFAKELMPKLEAGLEIEFAETKSSVDRFNDVRTTIALKYSL